jgi:hypothetical protein
MLVFSTLLVNNSAPLTFSLVYLPPPPSLCEYVRVQGYAFIQNTDTVYNGGWREWIGGLRQINTCRQVPLQVNKKSRHLGFGVFIDIWSKTVTSACGDLRMSDRTVFIISVKQVCTNVRQDCIYYQC